MGITGLLGYIGGIIIGVGVAYLVARFVIGETATRRNFLKMVIPAFIGGVVAVLLIEYTADNNVVFAWILRIFAVLVTIPLVIQGIHWERRQHRSGRLLLRAGRTANHRLVIAAGIFFAIAAIFLTGLLIANPAELTQLLRNPSDAFSDAVEAPLPSLVIIEWVLAVYMIWAGSTELELREDAICYLLSQINWKRVKSYQWEGKQETTLSLKLQSKLPNKLFTPCPSFRIPAERKADINRVLEQKIRSR
jgi:hypothetical protein